MLTADALETGLANFYGTDHYYKHSLNKNMVYTDGVKYFAENAEAYWFLDIVATEIVKYQSAEEFILIELVVTDSKAVIYCDDGNGRKFYEKAIDYTDCPVGDWKFYFTNKVLMIPSEY